MIMIKEEITILKKMQEEQRKTTNQLSNNQEQLLNGQVNLIRKTNELEEGQKRLEKGQKRLERGQEEIVTELRRLNNVVTVMEVENDKKFNLICEALNINQKPEEIENKEVTFRLLKGNKEDK